MNSKCLFSIGDVAKMFHISVSSLRHYEKAGLLTPARISEKSGYRYYSVEQFEVLSTIRYLRTLDMPLSEISDFLHNMDVNTIEEKLRQQREIVMQKQQELKRIQNKIDHRLHWLLDAQSVPLDTITLSQSAARRIVWVEDTLEIGCFLDMEVPIRKLDQSKTEAVIFPGKVGLGISVDHLMNGQTEKYDGLFLILDDEDIFTGATIELSESCCVRIHYRGSHTEAPAQYKKLLDYIRIHNMQITGFSQEITLIDYSITNDVKKFVTEISIPVKCRCSE